MSVGVGREMVVWRAPEQRLHGVGVPGRGGGMADAWRGVSVGVGPEMVWWRAPRTEAPWCGVPGEQRLHPDLLFRSFVAE
eukprot:7535459-Pyramimonas_sp.AAC.1